MSSEKKIEIGKDKVVKSSIWIFGGELFGQILRLVSNLIMTRLLLPEMFGLMTVANTVILGLWLCSFMGIGHNVIQSPRGEDQDFLDAAWTFQLFRGVLLWVLALCISLGLYVVNSAGYMPTGSVYASEQLPPVIAALSFLALISGFESMKKHLATRHMLVGRLTLFQLLTQAISLVAMIILALEYKSVWALVLGTLLQNILYVAGTYLFLPGKTNKPVWNKKEFISLFNFGKWLLASVMLSFFVKNIDKLILGFLVKPAILGIYGIAIFLVTAIQDVFNKWATSIALPILSRAHHDGAHGGLKNAYYKFALPFDLVTLFLCGLIFNAGYILIEVLYDSRYMAAGHMMQILSISIAASRTILAAEAYVAVGKPKLSVPMNILQIIILVVGIVPAYNYYGIDGAMYVIGFSIILTLPITWYYLRKLGILDWKREIISMPALFLGYAFAEVVIIFYNNVKPYIPFIHD